MPDPVINTLNEDDIRRLVRHPDDTLRAMAAQRVCNNLKSGKLSESERAFARQLLSYMVKDSAEIVRYALAITLKNSPELPRDIALCLAEDVDNIATPILANSPVFTDADLIEILRSRAAAKVAAVAKRPSISDYIVRAIIRYGDGHAVAELAANDGAEISQETAEAVLALYHDDDLIKSRFIARRDLPPKVMEKLITMVSENVAVNLVDRHEVLAQTAIDLAIRTRERATIDFVDQGWVTRDVAGFVKLLHEDGRLTPSLVMRSACSGQMRFVEHALSHLSNLSHAKAALMVHDAGPLGLRALCRHAGLSDDLFEIIQAACQVYHDIEASGLTYGEKQFRRLMLERILTQPLDITEETQIYLLDKLDALEHKAAA